MKTFCFYFFEGVAAQKIKQQTLNNISSSGSIWIKSGVQLCASFLIDPNYDELILKISTNERGKNMSVKDRIVTMTSRFRVFVDPDNYLVLLNLATGEAQALDVDEVFLEFESNYRIGAKVVEWDGNSCREQFN